MKTLSILLITFFTALTLTAQGISGQWNGALKVQGTQLRFVFNIFKTENSLSSTMDSPDPLAVSLKDDTKTENLEINKQLIKDN